MKISNKKGAVELSISTMVIIVLAMAMLILGLVLVKNIFSGATYNVNDINDKVKSEIGNLFSEDGKTVVYLADHKADVKQGKDWGIAFAIKNNVVGTSQTGTFNYEVRPAEISSDCKGLTKERVETWIKTRRSGTQSILPGQTSFVLTRITVPEDAPLCIVPFDIIVTKDGQAYATDFFDIVVK